MHTKHTSEEAMSCTQSYYHVVRTKRSERTIPIEAERVLYKYIYTFSTNKDCKVFRIGGMPDHIHILVGLPATLAIAVYAKELKEKTSRWLRGNELFPHFDGWADGYAALSCGHDALQGITAYIINQKEHHRHRSFAEEYAAWLENEGITIDARNFLKGDTREHP